MRRDLYNSIENKSTIKAESLSNELSDNNKEKELLNKIIQEEENGINLCNHKIDISNDCYDLMEKKLNKINLIIESLEKKLKNPESKTVDKMISRKKCMFFYNLALILKLKKDNLSTVHSKSLNSSQEQVFCHCKNVSYGDMIECDNKLVINYTNI